MAEHDANREPQPIDEEAAWAAIVAGYGEEPADPPGAKPFKSVEDLALLEGDRNGTRSGPDGQDALDLNRSGRSEGPAGTDGRDGADGPDGTDGLDGPDAGKKASEPPGPLKPPMPPASAADATGAATEAGANDEGTNEDGSNGANAAKDGAEDPESGKSALGSSITFAPGVGGPGIALPGAGGPRDYRLAEPGDNDTDDEEGHFVPPEPPPLPESDVTSRFAWLAVIGGPVLMLVAVLLSWDMTWWLTTLCVGGFLGGFATLVARMDPDDDESDDPGRGAVV
ncbi:hypothetical protein [Streptomyces sp. NPDC059092]|uniref:hypothetical protein n=1 Tax=Streptomyces sp. NPDC059092 TaxID=3346725 RepID=UPI0036CF7C14